MRDGVITEADTCREFVTPRLVEAGWNAAPHAIGEQRSFTSGHRIIESILLGQKRILATLATGTGKTCVAFQICWKLWNSRWNRTGEHRRPKVLFLADRNILVDDPMAKMFAPFGDARHKIAGGDTSQSRDMYFGIYQALTTSSADVFRQYRPDFFDLIIIDECHRGSSRDESAWRAVLDYFEPAVQFGMTATPLREESRDSYEYFGNPVYAYSLRQGIEDGFLAPYRVHRVITTVDAAGWRPSKDELDRYGREIPDDEYQTKDFERVVALRSRTRAMARHLTDLLKGTDRFAKTLVFCVDQEHAAEMRQELINLNSDLVKQYPDYVCRVTADEGAIGFTHLSHFQDVDKPTPVILLFFERGGPTDTIWYYELPLPEGRKKYSKTAPLQFEEFAPALAWWNNRKEGPQAWSVAFAAKRAAAVEAATPHWQRAEAERNAAIALGKPMRELEQAIQAAANGQKTELQDRLKTLKGEQLVHEQAAKSAQAEGDALYWPIFNLDLKNPNARAGLEHADPKDLIAAMRSHEAEVMRLLGEIEALVAEVQA